MAEKVNKVLLAGQVKHAQLFSAIKPDGIMSRMLQGLSRKNTDVLIGAFVRMIEGRGMRVVDSTLFLKPCCRKPASLQGALPMLTRRPTLPMAAKSPRRSRGWTSARPLWWPIAPAWPWRRWRARTPPSSALPA